MTSYGPSVPSADAAIGTGGFSTWVVTLAPAMYMIWERTRTMAIRIRKITAGWGTLLLTRSPTSRNLCILDFGAALASLIGAVLSVAYQERAVKGVRAAAARAP